MASPAVVVVITVAIVTLLALGVVVLALLHHLRLLTATLRSMRDDVAPALESLTRSTEVTQRELGRVSDAAIRLRDPDHPV